MIQRILVYNGLEDYNFDELGHYDVIRFNGFKFVNDSHFQLIG